MTPLILLTPQHTGTHFLRHLLELHPQISFWIDCNGLVAFQPMSYYHTHYYAGDMSIEEYKWAILEASPVWENWSRNIYRNIDIEVPAKCDVEYKMVHTHGNELHRQPHFKDDDILRIVTVRDPISSIISALRRNNNGYVPANRIIGVLKEIAVASWEPRAYKFPIDLLAARKQDALKVFDWLKLPWHEACEEYVKKWPKINETTEKIENYQGDKARPPLTEEYLADLRLAKEMLAEGKIHPVLDEWVEKLRAADIQEYFESLGYRNLLWFK